MINNIYNIVQELLNKNGRGILSPARFNLMCENAQIQELGNAIDESRRSKLSTQTYATDESRRMLDDVVDKLTKTTLLSRQDGAVVQDYHIVPTNYMFWGGASVNGVEIAKMESKQKSLFKRSQYVNPSDSNPICYLEGLKLYVLPTSVGAIYDYTTTSYVAVNEVEFSYYKYPTKPNWTYVTINNKALFDQSNSGYVDFELPYSFYNKLTMNILGQAGLHIRDEVVLKQNTAESVTEYQKDNSK